MNYIYLFICIIVILYCLFRKNTIETFNNRTIPKSIHQIWIGDKSINNFPHKLQYMSSFKNILDKSWEYRLWTNKDITIQNFPLTYHSIQKIKNKNKDKIKYASIADLMRYEIIYHHGGFYFDTNIELLQDISHLVKYQFVVCNENIKIIFIGYKHHLHFEKIWEKIYVINLI